MEFGTILPTHFVPYIYIYILTERIESNTYHFLVRTRVLLKIICPEWSILIHAG